MRGSPRLDRSDSIEYPYPSSFRVRFLVVRVLGTERELLCSLAFVGCVGLINEAESVFDTVLTEEISRGPPVDIDEPWNITERDRLCS